MRYARIWEGDREHRRSVGNDLYISCLMELKVEAANSFCSPTEENRGERAPLNAQMPDVKHCRNSSREVQQSMQEDEYGRVSSDADTACHSETTWICTCLLACSAAF